MAPSIESVRVGINGNLKSFSTNNTLQPSRFDLHALVEDIRSTAINETLCMAANNDTEDWIKRNRLQALTQLGPYSPWPCSSSSPYATNLNDKISAVAVNHPSDGYASSESRSSVSFADSRSSWLADGTVSNAKFETENHGRDEQAKKEQHFIFRRQLKIARKMNLRAVIHCRDADDDTIAIMKEILPRDSIFHLHCFTGSWKKAQKWIKEFPNVFIGITNLVTFPSAGDTHEVCRRLPLDRLLLETDAPFFVPKKTPKGTRFSHPGMAIHVTVQIAALKNVPSDAVLEATCNNTRYVYNIP